MSFLDDLFRSDGSTHFLGTALQGLHNFERGTLSSQITAIIGNAFGYRTMGVFGITAIPDRDLLFCFQGQVFELKKGQFVLQILRLGIDC